MEMAVKTFFYCWTKMITYLFIIHLFWTNMDAIIVVLIICIISDRQVEILRLFVCLSIGPSAANIANYGSASYLLCMMPAGH